MRNISITILLVLLLAACQTRNTRETSNPRTSHPQVEPTAKDSNAKPGKEIPSSGNLQSQGSYKNLDLPQPINEKAAELILDHGFFQISYSEKNRLPNWVSYHLRADNLKRKVAKRKNKFFADPQLLLVKMAHASPDDFDGHTYDRGHMAPSDDFAWDQKANDATFVMTNMAPQERSLNRGSWKKLEVTVRKWACTEGELRVVTGPIVESAPLRMSSQVPIPQKFFKVVLDETPPRKAIGFIYKQADGKAKLVDQALSLKEIEQKTGYKFFVDLAQNERKPLENAYNLHDWVESDCLPGRKKRP